MYILKIRKSAVTMQPPCPCETPSLASSGEESCERGLINKDRSGTKGCRLSSSTSETDSMRLMATEAPFSPVKPAPTPKDLSSIVLEGNPTHLSTTSTQQFEAMSAPLEFAPKPSAKPPGRRGRKP